MTSATIKRFFESSHIVFDKFPIEIHVWRIVRNAKGKIENWRLVYANPLALRSWNENSLPSLIDKTTDEIFGAGASEHYLEIVRTMFDRKESHTFIDYFENINKHFRFTSIPYSDFFITIGEDISDLVHQRNDIQSKYNELTSVNREIETTKFRMKLAAYSAEIGFWDLNIDTDELVWDEQMYRMYGIPESDFFGAYEAWSSCLHPDDKEMAEKTLSQAIEAEKNFHLEFRICQPNGAVRWIKADAWFQVDPFDNCRHFVGVNQDVSDQKEAEVLVIKAKERFKHLYDSSDVPIVDKDFTQVVRYFDELREASVSDLAEFLQNNPSQLRFISSLIKVNQINSAILTLFEADNVQAVLQSDVLIHNGNNDEMFLPQLIAIWENRPTFQMDATIVTLKGTKKYVHISMPIPNQSDICSNIPVSYFDITERKETQEKLKYQASHDRLTGLINRNEFESRAKLLLAKTAQTKARHTFCFMDLDQFKLVNDTCGHQAGDYLLRQLSYVLQRVVRKQDILARLGGDEFGLIMEDCPLEQSIQKIDNILREISEFKFIWHDKIHRIGVSIGVVEIHELVRSFDELLKEADVACYLAKEAGRNRYHISKPDDNDLLHRYKEMQSVTIIHEALEKNLFVIYAQPIVNLMTAKTKRYELLIRMKDCDNSEKIVSPGSFLPAAERYGVMDKIDKWMIQSACKALLSAPEFLNSIEHVSINLSGQSITSSTFMNEMMEFFNETDFPINKLCFEITETVAISNLNSATKFIEIMKKEKCKFSLDDFGTGLSSFGYLKNLPVDILKIDGVFVRDIVDDPIDAAIVKSINEVGKVTNMETVAEFVETEEIAQRLKEMGIDYGQGYGLGEPKPLNDIIHGYARVGKVKSTLVD